MKKTIVLATSLMLAAVANAGIAGLLSSKTRDWQFIQSSGGIRISTPIKKEGRIVLPVDYWPEGNSGLVVRRIELKQSGSQIVVRVVTQLVETGSDTARIHNVDLSGIPAGSYEVYYETAGDPLKHLGRIEIK